MGCSVSAMHSSYRPSLSTISLAHFWFALHIGASLNIIDCMSGKATALLGIVGAAAVGIYFKWRRPRPAPSDVIEPKGSVSFRSSGRIEIDDDAAADIIKRARPALERARESYAW